MNTVGFLGGHKNCAKKVKPLLGKPKKSVGKESVEASIKLFFNCTMGADLPKLACLTTGL